MNTKRYCPYCMTPIREGEPCTVCGLTEGSYHPMPYHLPPGTVLMERYLIGRVLGEGGFGITYIGCDLRLEMKIAVKEYFPSERVTRMSSVSLEVTSFSNVSEEAYRHSREKFLREARTMARMSKQPEIVGVRDYFEANGTAYIVMEYIEGTTLSALAEQRGGRIPAGELLHMMEPLFGALQGMHDLGLIHRDISPENIMLENGNIRLLDFGCARDEAAGNKTLTISLKHGYAPLEQYQSKGQGPWTDVYALAATIYFCLTGKRPPQAMDRLMEDELILPRRLGVDLTEKQENALLYGMGVHPRRRFRSMQEFHAALYEGTDWRPETEAENLKSGKFRSDSADSESTEPKDTGFVKADISKTESGHGESAETEKKPDNASREPEYGKRKDYKETVQTPEKPAWRTWLAGHRTMALAGAAAAVALILIGASVGVLTSRQSGQKPSVQADSDSTAELAEVGTAQDTENVTEESTEQATETVTEESAAQETENITEEPAEQATETVMEASVMQDTDAFCEYEVGYISAEQYEACLDGGEQPDAEMITGEGTLTDGLNALVSSDAENTGYCVLISREPSGYEDLVVPEGLKVFVAYGDCMNLKSITANGDIAIWEVVNTPGTLEIKEGVGRIRFQDATIDGMLVGSGEDDKVEFSHGVFLNGMSGVENVYAVGFEEDRHVNLESRGPLEFYNIYCEGNDECGDTQSLWLDIEGYSDENIPVFHNSFDFGSGTFSDEEGNTWDANYELGVTYIEDFNVDGDWVAIDIGTGKQAVKFDEMPDAAIMEFIQRTGYYCENAYSIDMNGCTYNPENAYGVRRFVDCDTMTAQEAFQSEGLAEWDYEASTLWVCDVPDVSQALRAMEADQQNGSSVYYRLEMPVGAEITDTLMVPDAIAGVQYHVNNEYDEATGTTSYVPIRISAISVPEGKVLMISEGQIAANTLTISGAGRTDLRNCVINADTVTASGELALQDSKINANVTAEEVSVVNGAAVKSLICEDLGSIMEYSRFVVSGYLKFDTGHLNATVIYAYPGAYLKFGAIDNVSMPEQSDGEVEVYLGVEGDCRAQLYLGGSLTLGTVSDSYTDDNGETQEYSYDKALHVSECDVAAARDAGACFTDDCFTMDYQYDWNDDKFWGRYRTLYEGEEKCIVAVSSVLDAAEVLRDVVYETDMQISGKETAVMLYACASYYEEYEELDEGIDGDKYWTFYSFWNDSLGGRETVKTSAYFLIEDASASDGQ